MDNCPQNLPTPFSHITEDNLKQSEIIFLKVGKDSVQAYINLKAYYDKEDNASQPKEKQNVCVLQPKADHQGTKFPTTDFRWIGSHIVERALPKNKYLLRKVATNKTQVLHHIRLRSFTPRKSIPDAQTTSQEWKLDPEVIIKHDDLYTRAWECENGTPIFNNDRDEPDKRNSPELTRENT